MKAEPGLMNPPPAKGRGNTMAIVAIIVAIIAIGFSAYLYVSEGNQLSAYTAQTSALTSTMQQTNTQLATLDSKISELNTKIATLNATVVKINTGGGTPTPTGLTPQQIYNKTASSIVLIEVPILGGVD